MVALYAQLLLRTLMAEAEGLAQTPMARGRDWSPPEEGHTRECDTNGHGRHREMQGHRQYAGGGVCLPSVPVWSSGRGSTVLAGEGERQREENHQQGGSHKDRVWCPSKSHGTTKRLAVQRTKETFKGACDI